MKNKVIDIKGLSDRAAIELLCREINSLRSEFSRNVSALDAENVIFSDGSALEEYLKKIADK